MGHPSITTERLILRGWQAGDVEPYGAMLADPATARFIVPGGRPVRPEDAWQHAAVMAGHWDLHDTGMFVIADRATGAFLGRAGVWSPPGWFGLEVGWGVTPQARGRGIASEAAIAAMRWTFAISDAEAIIHCIDEANAPSQRLAKRLGAIPGRGIILFGHPAVIWTSRRQRFAELHG